MASKETICWECRHDGRLPPVKLTRWQRSWWLAEDYHAPLPDGREIHVHAGFCFDLASVPRVLWALIGPHELSLPAPLIHDLLYAYGGDPRPKAARFAGGALTRREADAAFLHLMRLEFVPRWRRNLAWLAVRAVGWRYWRGRV